MKKVSIFNNTDTMNKYKIFLELKDMKPCTIEGKIYTLVPLFKFLSFKKAEEITKQDIENYFIHMKRSNKRKSTQLKDFMSIRAFFNWLIPNNNFFENIKMKQEKPDTSDKEYVNVDDVKAMLNQCKSLRDRVLILLLWETGARLGELLAVDLGDLKPQRHGIVITVSGKTGTRDILIIDSVPDVQSWLNIYKPSSQNAPLFPVLGRHMKGRLQQRGAQAIVKSLAKKANIKKSVYCHSFRHGRLTELSNAGFSEMQLRVFAGWTKNSEMPGVYLHTTKDDVFKKLLQLKGVETDEIKKETVKEFTTKKCPRCNVENSFDAKYCKGCSLILDPLTAANYEKDIVDIDMTVMQAIATDPRILQALADRIVQNQKSKK